MTKNSKSDITFSDEIIKELSEEKGIPYDELEEIINLNLEYIKQLTYNPEVTVIKIGKGLGKLVSDTNLIKAEIKTKYSSKIREAHKQEVVIPRYKKIYEFVGTVPRKKTNYNKGMPFLWMLKNTVQKMLDKKVSVFRNSEKVWETISKKQNEINLRDVD